MKNYLFLVIGLTLSACGGGGGDNVTSDYSVVRKFSDNSGIGRAVGSNSTETGIVYFITPEVVSVVQSANETGEVTPDVDPQNFPLINQISGYDFRQGNLEGTNVTVVAKSGQTDDPESLVFYFELEEGSLIFVGVDGLTGVPTGQMTYAGLYSVEDSRYPDWMQIGNVSLTANFDTKTFSIDASSTDTTLRGNGFIDITSGQISSASLLLNDTILDELRDANLLGNLGGSNASSMAALWYTSEDAPIFKGAIIGDKQ